MNNKKAYKYFKKAAYKNIAQAQYHLGILFRDGKGVIQNSKEAKYWFKKSNIRVTDETKNIQNDLALKEPEDVHLYVK